MKKVFHLLITVFLAYITAFYTTGKENGYTELFDFKFIDNIFTPLKDKIPITKPDYLNEGKIFLEKKELDFALNKFKLASEEKNSSEINYLIGHTYLLKNDYSTAKIYLDDAINLDSKNSKAYLDRGYVKYMQSYNNEAINDLFFATELAPEDAKAYYYLGLCYEKESKLEVALQSIETALKYDSAYIDARFKAGYIAYDLDSFRLSINHYLKLIKIDSIHQYGLLNLGLAYSQLDFNDSAMFYYDIVIENYPKYYLAYNNKGYIFQKEKGYEKAVKYYSIANQLNSSDTYSLWNRADCFFELKKYQKAIGDYKKVYELRADYYIVLKSIGECYTKLNQKSKAEEYFLKYKTASGS